MQYLYDTATSSSQDGLLTSNGRVYFGLKGTGLQKSTSQPELSSGGGSSLSSGKLSKLLVSTADVTCWEIDSQPALQKGIRNQNV